MSGEIVLGDPLSQEYSPIFPPRVKANRQQGGQTDGWDPTERPHSCGTLDGGHISAKVTEHYTHIITNAARSAVELLEKIPPQPQFVNEFVDLTAGLEAKSL